jgi:hypothetical protein
MIKIKLIDPKMPNLIDTQENLTNFGTNNPKYSFYHLKWRKSAVELIFVVKN